MDIENFTYDAYKNLINRIRLNGYSIVSFHNYKGIEKPCIIRRSYSISSSRLEQTEDYRSLSKRLTTDIGTLVITILMQS